MPRIELLGGPRVIGPDAALVADALAGRRGRVALAVLAMERGRVVDLDELAEALWPAVLPPTWRPAVRSAISRVREVFQAAGIGATVVVRDGGVTLVLPPDVAIDVEVARADVLRAEQALAAGDHRLAARTAGRAARVVAEPLLPRETSEWAERTRRRLRDLHRRALHAHCAALVAGGDHDAAADVAEELLRAEPFDEGGHRLLIRALAAGGRRADALRAYERCRRLLADELGLDPEPATATLQLEVLGGVPGRRVDGPVSARGALVRDRDRRRLDRWWDGVAGGGPAVLAVAGESGTGKYDLIEDLARRAASMGTAVVWRRPESGSTAAEIVGAAVAAPAARVLVVVERADAVRDLHDLLALPALTGGRTGIVVGHRPDRPWLGGPALGRFLREADRRRVLVRLQMSQLELGDAVQMLEGMTGARADDAAVAVAAELVAECGGNQGLMRLRILGLLSSGALRADPAGWRVPARLDDEPLPGALLDAIRRWAADAPAPLVALLGQVALADGHEVDRPARQPVAAVIRLAVACGLLAATGSGYRFVHPVIGRCWADVGRAAELGAAAR